MTFKLSVTITHPSFDKPVTKELFFHGDSFEAVLAQIDTLPQHIYNLTHYRKTAFKDQRGVKHKWELKQVEAMH